LTVRFRSNAITLAARALDGRIIRSPQPKHSSIEVSMYPRAVPDVSIGSILRRLATLLALPIITASTVDAMALYVTDINANYGREAPPSAIVGVDADTGAQEIFAYHGLITPLPLGITLGPDNALYVAQELPVNIIRIELSTRAQSFVTQGGFLQHPRSIAAGPDGNLYVCDGQSPEDSTVGAVIRINRITGEQSILTSGDHLRGPVDLAFTPSGELLVLDDSGPADLVVRVDLATGAQTLITPDHYTNPLRVASAIAAASASVAYVTDGVDDVRIFRVDLTSGQVSLAAGGGCLNGPNAYARDLVAEPSGTLLVLEEGSLCSTPQILRIDPSTGAQSTLVADGLLAAPWAMTLGPDIPTSIRMPSWGTLKIRYR
jgi:hypothetical protein